MQLTEWLLENSAALNLKADKYTWVNEWLPGYFDYGVIISVSGKKYSGRGIDANEKIAFEKASAEALERAALGLSRLSMPWATAAYPIFEGACARAYYELLGIDRVFCHHFCRKRIKPVSLQETIGSLSGKILENVLARNKIKLNLYELRPSSDAKVVCAIAYGTENRKLDGFITGFGADESIEIAKLHAIVECARTAVVCLCTDYKPEEPIENLKARRNPRWHFWQTQNAESMAHLCRHLLPKSGEEPQFKPESISIKDASFIQIKTLASIFPDIPLFFVQAHSDKLIEPQFGEFIGGAQTMKRLEVFNGRPIQVDTLVPHFYG